MSRTVATGVVVSATGDPVAGTLVVIVEATAAMPEIALAADEHGRFSIHLPEGSFRLRAESGGRRGEVDVSVPATPHVRLSLA